MLRGKTQNRGDESKIRASEPCTGDVSPEGNAGIQTTTAASASKLAGKSPDYGWFMLGTLSALMGFGAISTDLYLPAMPAMSQSFGTDAGTLELTISGYLIGFSIGQLLWGPISDRHGRRVPVVIGLALFVVGSAGCALSYDVWTMISWRLVQAIGASAGVVLGRAMVRDLFEGHRAAQMMSTLMMVMAIAPLIGPFVGGQILVSLGWHAIFWSLVGFGLATLGAVILLPETLVAERRNAAPLDDVLIDYGRLLCDRRLMGYGGVGGFFYGGMFAYIAGTPFAYITYHHVPADLYGIVFAVGIVGVMGSNFINARLVTRFGSDSLLVAGTCMAAISGAILAASAWADWGGLWGLVGPLFIFTSSAGFIIANSIVGALADFPQRAGAVSALIGAIHYGSGIISSALLSAFADNTPWPLGWVIAIMGVGSLISTRLISTSKRAKIHPRQS